MVLIVPTVLGMLLRQWSANVGATVELVGGPAGHPRDPVPGGHLGAAQPRAARQHRRRGLRRGAGPGADRHRAGLRAGALLRQDPVRSRTIALETGIQNGPLAVLIVLLTFEGQMEQDALLIPVLYALFIVLTSSAVTVWFRRITTREELARDWREGARRPRGAGDDLRPETRRCARRGMAARRTLRMLRASGTRETVAIARARRQGRDRVDDARDRIPDPPARRRRGRASSTRRC